MIVKSVATKEELNDAFHVRTEVFVKEQGVAPEKEMDEHDAHADHIVVYDGKKPVGAGRLRLVDGLAKLERICVLPPYRKLGLGKLIVGKLEETARAKGLSQAKLHGQVHAGEFYEKAGYKKLSGDIFMEEGIPHIAMIKNLY